MILIKAVKTNLVFFKNITAESQWRMGDGARGRVVGRGGGGASEGTPLEAQVLRGYHTFCSQLKTRLQKFRPKYA